MPSNTINGIYNYGTLGTKTKNKLLKMWRDLFLFDDVEEIETSILTSYDYNNKFVEYIVEDRNGIKYKANDLLKDYFKQKGMYDIVPKVDLWSITQMAREINKYNLIEGKESKENPDKKLFIEVKTKNKMYELPMIDLDNNININYLRPELAQGIFDSLASTQMFLGRELPFGIAQIGKVFMNETSPQLFTRMKEYTQATIEYFVDPLNNNYNMSDEYLDYNVSLLNNPNSIRHLLKNKVIHEKQMAYFIVKIHMFVKVIGLDMEKVRVVQCTKQHFNLEVLIEDDWISCASCIDRSSYGKSMKITMKRKLNIIDIKKTLEVQLDMNIITQKYKETADKVKEYYDNMSQEQLDNIKNNMLKDREYMYVYIEEKMHIIDKSMIEIVESSNRVEYQDFYPQIIESSFNIDILMCAMLEHNDCMKDENTDNISKI